MQILCTLYLPIAFREIVNVQNIKSISGNIIVVSGLLIIGQMLFSAGVLFLITYTSQYIIMGLRNDLWNKILYLRLDFFDENETGSIMSRIINDTMIIGEFVTNELLSVLSGGISIIGSLVLLFIVDYKMAGLLLILIPIVALIINPLNRKLYKISKGVMDQMAIYQGKLGGILSNIRLVKSCVAEGKEVESGNAISYRIFKLGLKEGKVVAVIQPITTMLMFCILLLVFGYGSIRVANNSMSAGDLVAIIYYLFQIVIPCMGLTNFLGQLNKNKGTLEHIYELLNEEKMEQQIETVQNMELNFPQTLAMKDVSFSYVGRGAVLKNITFAVEKNSVIALVGQSGAGKTTLFSLLEQFYIPDSGAIYYGNKNIKSIPLKEWRKKIAYVEQDCPIISGTIWDNLVYGLDEYDEKVIDRTLVAVELDQFILSLPEGVRTTVGEMGVKLSGGQRQRIAIARAIIRDPEILLLDEATANLDACTEKVVQRSLERLMRGRITIIAAHRFSTIYNADAIIVLDQGIIKGIGTHAELSRNNDLYQTLLKSQIKGLINI